MGPQRRLTALIVALLLSLAAASAAQAPRSFLWKVQSGTRVLYLAGSVHALGADMYPLAPAFQRAFDASGTLVEEIDLAEADTLSALPMLMSKGMYQNGRTFDQAVSRDTVALVNAKLQSVPGLSDMLKPMKPWVVTMMLTALQVQASGLDASLGLDKHFYDKAVAAGKPVIGLETAESQIDRFDKMPESVQEQMLRSTLKDMDAGNGELKAIMAAWKRGDTASIEQSMLGGFRAYPAAYTSLVVERNRNWLPQIDACLARSTPCFVIVGAAHLVGPDGLLTLLQNKGYRLEQQ